MLSFPLACFPSSSPTKRGRANNQTTKKKETRKVGKKKTHELQPLPQHDPNLVVDQARDALDAAAAREAANRGLRDAVDVVLEDPPGQKI